MAASFALSALTAGKRRHRQLAGNPAIELGALRRRQAREPLLPGEARRPAALSRRAPCRGNLRRHLEWRRPPAEPRAGALDLIGAQRRAMGLFRSRLGRGAEPDRGAAGDQGRLVGAFRPCDGGGDRFGIVAVDPGRVPAGRLEASWLVDRIGQRQRPVDRNAVVVEQNDQLGEAQMTGKRDGLLADALHQVAVGGQHEGVVIDDVGAELRRQMPFRNRHADRVGKALTERPGRGLDPGRMAVFRMPGRQRAQLAEALDLGDGHRLITEQMERRINRASSRARRKARSGRDRANADRRGRT